MLACRFNYETTALEIETWTPGPWSLPVVALATRLEGSGWSMRFPEPEAQLVSMGMRAVDAINLYEIDLTIAIALANPVELRWVSDPGQSYALLRTAFDDRWAFEGIEQAAWSDLWLGRDIDREISGIAYLDAVPIGFILAEDIDYPIGSAVASQRFYRSFALLPAFRRRGLALRLYQTSLLRAQAAGVASARWVCFASNAPIARLMDRLGARVIESQPFYRGQLPLTGGNWGEISA